MEITVIISHPKEILVVPRESFDEICAVGLPRLKLKRKPSIGDKLLPVRKKALLDGEAKLLELTRGLRLREWFEDAEPYRKMMALASVTKGGTITEDIYRELSEKEYRPASFTEAMYYFHELAGEKVELGHVFHLGTRLPPDENYLVWTIVTIGYDKIKAEKIYPKTPLSAGAQIVAVKEETVPQKKK